MKRVFQTLLFLFFFYYLIQIVYSFFDKCHELTYTKLDGNTEVSIKEVYNSNQKNERSNYFLEFTVDDKIFYFKTYDNLKKSKNIVSDIKYFSNDQYACILPIFRNNQLLSDIICQENGVTTYYRNIKGLDAEVDNFASDIQIYNVEDWEAQEIERPAEPLKLGNIFVDKNLINSGLYLGLTSYKGLYNINDKVSKHIIEIAVFYNDAYNQKINAQIDNYYIVADYNKDYEFSNFYLLNLLKNETQTIQTNYKISFNSYVQGVVDNKVYLIDVENQKQYEINIKDKIVKEIGNENTLTKFYRDGEWEDISIYEIIKNKETFTDKKVDGSIFDEEYCRIDQIGTTKSGYYYLYKKNENTYDVYKAYMEQPNNPIFLFSVSNIDRLTYINDQIIFIEKNFVKVYSDKIGIKNLIEYDELEFNSDINIYAYYKK